jgi:hypothetical protein
VGVVFQLSSSANEEHQQAEEVEEVEGGAEQDMDLVKLLVGAVLEEVRRMVHQLRRAAEGQGALLRARHRPVGRSSPTPTAGPSSSSSSYRSQAEVVGGGEGLRQSTRTLEEEAA